MSTSACLEFIFVVFTALHQADVSRVFLCNLRMIDFNVFLHLLHCNIKYIVLCLHTPYTFLSEFLYLYKLHTISFSLNILLLNFVHLMKQLTRDRLLSYLHIICMFIHFFCIPFIMMIYSNKHETHTCLPCEHTFPSLIY